MTTFRIDTAGVHSFDDFVARVNDGFCSLVGGKWNGNLDALNDYLSWSQGILRLIISDASSCERVLGVWDTVLEILADNDHVQACLCFPDRLVFMRGTICIEMRDEPAYTLRSADNRRWYSKELDLGGTSSTSKHGIRSLNPEGWSLLVAAAGGCSAVSPTSLVIFSDRLVVGVGDSIVCCSTVPAQVTWHRQADPATVFGVHPTPSDDGLLVHGELQLSRFQLDGSPVWQFEGADIFTGSFSVEQDHVVAEDFEGRRYRVDMASGRSAGGGRPTGH